MTRTLRTLLFAVAAMAVSFTAGCSDAGTPVETMAAPEAAAHARATGTTELASASQVDVLARFYVKPQITIAWAKKWIGPEGGRLEFQGFAVDVPAGAVSKVTMFSIRLPVDPQGSEHVVAEFGPHGSKFSRPVTLSFPLRGTTIEGNPEATVVWWNNGSWVDMGAWVSADGSRLSTYTDHFSEYGTTAKGGGLALSGG